MTEWKDQRVGIVDGVTRTKDMLERVGTKLAYAWIMSQQNPSEIGQLEPTGSHVNEKSRLVRDNLEIIAERLILALDRLAVD